MSHRSTVITADGTYTAEARGDALVDVRPADHATERLERRQRALRVARATIRHIDLDGRGLPPDKCLRHVEVAAGVDELTAREALERAEKELGGPAKTEWKPL